jgi:hypothetical protein
MCSSVILQSVELQLVADVSSQPVGYTFNVQAILLDT